jgi:hypothetical protein
MYMVEMSGLLMGLLVLAGFFLFVTSAALVTIWAGTRHVASAIQTGWQNRSWARPVDAPVLSALALERWKRR